MTPKEALVEAIRILGSQTAVAAAAGEDVETGHVYYWLNKAPEVPPKYCPGIERATRAKGETIYCEQLCPGMDWAAVRAARGPSASTKAPRLALESHATGEGERRTSDEQTSDPLLSLIQANRRSDRAASDIGEKEHAQ